MFLILLLLSVISTVLFPRLQSARSTLQFDIAIFNSAFSLLYFCPNPHFALSHVSGAPLLLRLVLFNNCTWKQDDL